MTCECPQFETNLCMEVILWSLLIWYYTEMTYLQVAAAANLASLGVEAAVHLGDPLCLAPINKETNELFIFL